MANKKLGIYFSKDTLIAVETIDRSIKCYATLSLGSIDDKSQIQTEELVSDKENKQLSLIQTFLKDNKIEAKKVFLALSDKEQFIRSFQMVLLSKSEMEMGIRFEAKKYIPFKTEDLIFDYQKRISRKFGKMDVLFVAVNKESLDKNISIFSDIGARVEAVEPASFALLRILSITGQLYLKSSFAVVAMQGEDVEFIIVDKGFPCFSREIKLSRPPQESESPETEDNFLKDSLANEIRVSLDYFRRQFSRTSFLLDKIMFLSKETPMQELISSLSDNLSIPFERVDLERDKELTKLPDLNALKAYALTLKDKVKINLSIDLSKKRHAQPVLEEHPQEGKPFVFNINMIKRPLIFALGLMVLAYGLPQIEVSKNRTKLKQLRKEAEEALPGRLKGSALDNLKQTRKVYAEKIEVLEKLIGSKVNIISSWNILPVTLNTGLWLEELRISVAESSLQLQIKGVVYLGDSNSETKAARDFLQKLQNNVDFMRGLGKLELTSLASSQIDKYTVTRFEISGS